MIPNRAMQTGRAEIQQMLPPLSERYQGSLLPWYRSESSIIFLHLSRLGLAVEWQKHCSLSFLFFVFSFGSRIPYLTSFYFWQLSGDCPQSDSLLSHGVDTMQKEAHQHIKYFYPVKSKQDLKQLQNWELEMSGVLVTIWAACSLLAPYNWKPALFVITGIIAMVRGPSEVRV